MHLRLIVQLWATQLLGVCVCVCVCCMFMLCKLCRAREGERKREGGREFECRREKRDKGIESERGHVCVGMCVCIFLSVVVLLCVYASVARSFCVPFLYFVSSISLTLILDLLHTHSLLHTPTQFLLLSLSSCLSLSLSLSHTSINSAYMRGDWSYDSFVRSCVPYKLEIYFR